MRSRVKLVRLSQRLDKLVMGSCGFQTYRQFMIDSCLPCLRIIVQQTDISKPLVFPLVRIGGDLETAESEPDKFLTNLWKLLFF